MRSIQVRPPAPHEVEDLAEVEGDAQHEAYCGLKVTREQPHAIAAIVDICDPKGRRPGEDGYANEDIQIGDLIQKVRHSQISLENSS